VSVERNSGFTLVELLVATTITLCITAAIYAVIAPARDLFTTEAEASDMQQRLRVAASTLSRDLQMAGAGADFGPDAGPLSDALPAVLPYRLSSGGDPPGSFRRDAVTVIYVPSLRAQTTIAHSVAAQSGAVGVNISPGCPLNDAACGFASATSALIYEPTGAFDVFDVTGVSGSQLDLHHAIDDSRAVHPAGSRIVEAVVRSYSLKADPKSATSQLMRGDVPLVDHVVRFSLEYFGRPAPPAMRMSLNEPAGPWTTYGPRPPAPGEQPTAYPPGENCAFSIDGTLPGPRLATLTAGEDSVLARLTESELIDGPWCPDAFAPNRFDADLLRIRRIAVTIRVEAAIDALRGPAGPLFARPGSSTGGRRFLPDQEVRFSIAPRNVNLTR